MADKGYPGNSFGEFLNQGGEIAGNVRVAGTLTAVGAASVNLGNDVGFFTVAGAPVDGASGTQNGVAGKGSLLIDITNGILYINTNTKASPTWTKVGLQS